MGHKIVKRQVIFEINYYNGKWHYNQPVWKSKNDHKQTKRGDTHEFLNNAGSKIVDKVGYIFLEEGKQFHPEMISNVPSLNEIT